MNKKIIVIISVYVLLQPGAISASSFRYGAQRIVQATLEFGPQQAYTAGKACFAKAQEYPVEVTIGAAMGGSAAFLASDLNKGVLNTLKNTVVGSFSGAVIMLNRGAISQKMHEIGLRAAAMDAQKKRKALVGGSVGAFSALILTDKDAGILKKATNVTGGAAIGAALALHNKSLSDVVNEGFKAVNYKLDVNTKQLNKLTEYGLRMYRNLSRKIKKNHQKVIENQAVQAKDTAEIKAALEKLTQDLNGRFNKVDEGITEILRSQELNQGILEALGKKLK